MSNEYRPRGWVEQLEGRVLFARRSVDESFGTQGGVLMWHANPIMFATGQPSLVVQADGKIMVTGYTTQGDQSAATVLRLNSDGSIDTSFADQVFFDLAKGKMLRRR